MLLPIVRLKLSKASAWQCRIKFLWDTPCAQVQDSPGHVLIIKGPLSSCKKVIRQSLCKLLEGRWGKPLVSAYYCTFRVFWLWEANAGDKEVLEVYTPQKPFPLSADPSLRFAQLSELLQRPDIVLPLLSLECEYIALSFANNISPSAETGWSPTYLGVWRNTGCPRLSTICSNEHGHTLNAFAIMLIALSVSSLFCFTFCRGTAPVSFFFGEGMG